MFAASLDRISDDDSFLSSKGGIIFDRWANEYRASMTTFPRGMNRRIFLSLCAIFLSFVPVSIIAHNDRADVAAAAAVSASPEDARPYRFAFNVVDFQHRFENKGTCVTRERERKQKIIDRKKLEEISLEKLLSIRLRYRWDYHGGVRIRNRGRDVSRNRIRGGQKR